MPELPEVETIKNELLPHVLGRTIESVDIAWDRIVKQPSVAAFRERVVGRKITEITRRGKYLFFHLDSGELLVMHMKMTGSLLVNPGDGRFARAVLHLDKGVDVYFRDPRKFGRMWLEKDASAVLKKLGPEPLDDDFTPAVLAALLRGRTAPVKAVILDQAVIAGIGNMYADEALFAAGIHPVRPAQSLTKAEVDRLYDAILLVLRKALKRGGASVRNYIRPDGDAGTAHAEFNVAHGTGKRCPRCGAAIERIVVRGRGTYLCPRCQKMP
ncbi:MAG: bifunctional DNA-formamidopyrimidine glycosylase/DNA-(apurinic or apyrimidinic site) lyase [Dehalococcoidales bacterium]|jgi:formamidopyrimidine-DNA glycosylase